MKTYLTLEDLAKLTRCSYAQRTDEGWVARRTTRKATHRLYYTVTYGKLERNRVVATPLAICP